MATKSVELTLGPTPGWAWIEVRKMKESGKHETVTYFMRVPHVLKSLKFSETNNGMYFDGGLDTNLPIVVHEDIDVLLPSKLSSALTTYTPKYIQLLELLKSPGSLTFIYSAFNETRNQPNKPRWVPLYDHLNIGRLDWLYTRTEPKQVIGRAIRSQKTHPNIFIFYDDYDKLPDPVTDKPMLLNITRLYGSQDELDGTREKFNRVIEQMNRKRKENKERQELIRKFFFGGRHYKIPALFMEKFMEEQKFM